MNEFFLPVSPAQNSEMALNSSPSTTPMDQQSPVDKCHLEKDALRGILMELKRGVKVMQERQNALHRCMTGRNLKDTTPGADGYRNAVNLMGGASLMTMGLDQIAFAAGVTLDGN